MVKLRNKLPGEAAASPCVEFLKHRLDRHLPGMVWFYPVPSLGRRDKLVLVVLLVVPLLRLSLIAHSPGVAPVAAN